jgi:hypothetical protein
MQSGKEKQTFRLIRDLLFALILLLVLLYLCTMIRGG